jgi:hypothetical protein
MSLLGDRELTFKPDQSTGVGQSRGPCRAEGEVAESGVMTNWSLLSWQRPGGGRGVGGARQRGQRNGVSFLPIIREELAFLRGSTAHSLVTPNNSATFTAMRRASSNVSKSAMLASLSVSLA